MNKQIMITIMACTLVFPAYSQDDQGAQSRESMAVDATATQWSFQFAHQWMTDYYRDQLEDGSTRPLGLDNYAQLRIVAPIPLKKLAILPRLTVRHYENLENKKTGFGNTELFGLIVPGFSDWGTGRAGIGPLVTLPGNPDVSRDEWGYGVAAAVVHNTGNWFIGILFTQSFRTVDPRTLPQGKSKTNPLGIAPFVNYRFGSTGIYVQTADLVAQFDWDTGKFYLPFGGRLGKVWVWETSSLNIYGEYMTSAIYKNWNGPAVKNSWRLNVSYTIPIGI